MLLTKGAPESFNFSFDSQIPLEPSAPGVGQSHQHTLVTTVSILIMNYTLIEQTFLALRWEHLHVRWMIDVPVIGQMLAFIVMEQK